MNKKKSFLGIYLIVSFVLIIAAVIVSLTAGIKLGTDVGGGTQFEVTIDGTVASNKQIQNIKDVLHKNHLHAEEIFVEDKLVDTVIVVRIADKTVKNQAEVKAGLVQKLGVEAEDISEFSTFNGTITKRVVLYTSIAIVCVLLLLFFAGWIRYNIVSGLTLMFAVLHTLMLNVSLLVLTRLPVTMITMIEILCGIILALFAFILLLERIRENAQLKHNEGLSTEELVQTSNKSVLKPLVFLAILITVVAIAFVCVPVRFVTLSACGLLVSIATAVYTYYFVGVGVHEKLLEFKVNADKMRLSKNDSPAPQKDSKRSAKAKTQEKEEK